MIKQIVPSEVCLTCRGCCRFSARNSSWVPMLRNEEVTSLLDGAIPPAFISPDKKMRLITDHSDVNAYLCPCLNLRDDTCKIYARRPFECQLYPLVLARCDDKYFLAADSQCPFVEQHTLEVEFKEYIETITAFLNSQEGIAILLNNPHLFQEYPGIVILSELKLHGGIQKTITGS